MGPLLQGKAWLLAGATLVGGAILATILYNALLAPDPAPPATTEMVPEMTPEVPADTAAVTPSETTPETPPVTAEEVSVVTPPVFDVVRVAEDGGALVAGSSEPLAGVVLRVDGAPVAEVPADASGQFVAMFALGYSDAVQILTLESILDDGRVVRSEERVVLTPRPAPVEMALVEPQPDADPAPVAEVDPAPIEPAPADTATADAIPVAPQEPVVDLAAADTVEPDVVEQVESAPVAAVTEPEPPVAPSPVPEIAQAPVAAPEPAMAMAAIDENPLPRAFVVGGGGEVRLLDRAPRVMDNVVIDVIAYSARGDVQISGRASSSAGEDANLRIYLNNRPVAMAQAANGDWALDLPDVDPGVYTLRVDQLDPGGQVVSRFETPFQREAPALVVAAQARLAQQRVATAGGNVAMPDPVSAPEPAPAPAGDAPVVDLAAAPPSTPSMESAVTAPAPEPEPRPEPNTAQATPEPAPQPEPARPAVAVETAAVAAPVAAPVAQTPPAQPSIALVTVQPGESLWRISSQHYGEGERYVVIYRANRSQIRNPDLIYPGQIFVLPE